MLNCDKTLRVDPGDFVARMADLASLDAGRLRLWLFTPLCPGAARMARRRRDHSACRAVPASRRRTQTSLLSQVAANASTFQPARPLMPLSGRAWGGPGDARGRDGASGACGVAGGRRAGGAGAEGQDGGGERGSPAVLLRADLRRGCGHPSPALISARHTSMMSATPRRPASPATGR